MSATAVLRGLLAGIALLFAIKAVGLVARWPGFGTATAPAMASEPARPAPPAAPPPPPAAPPQPDAGEANAALGAALRARREALEERERALAMRETVLAAAERRLNGRIEELAGLQARLERDAAQAAEREETHWRSLAKLYETMRPREAAAVFNELDMPVLVQVMDRMGERRAAPILGAMQPERVRQLTVELARHRAARPPEPPTDRPRP
jgi:flagellar motility protein MotE (MotC chaperone)